MVVIISLLFMEWASVLAAEQQQTWVNTHPELENIVSNGVREAINVYDKSLREVIDVPDFHYRSDRNDTRRKAFNAWAGELRKMKSISRVGGLNITWLNEDRRELRFFVHLKRMEITYHLYNQSNYDFYKEGKIIITPESNLLLIKCDAVHERYVGPQYSIPSWAHVSNATLVSVSVGKRMVRLIPRTDPDQQAWMNVSDVNELMPPLFDTIGAVFLSHVRQGLNEALKRKQFVEFYKEYFSKNHTNKEEYRL